MSKIENALKHAEMELKQLHSCYMPECKSGCPTLKYIEECQEALDEWKSVQSLLNEYIPQPRICNFMGMQRTANWIGSTWLEPEEFCYPKGGMTRKAFVVCDDGTFAVVTCGIPNTVFSIPAYRVIKGKRIKGYIHSDEHWFMFTQYQGENSMKRVNRVIKTDSI